MLYFWLGLYGKTGFDRGLSSLEPWSSLVCILPRRWFTFHVFLGRNTMRGSIRSIDILRVARAGRCAKLQGPFPE